MKARPRTKGAKKRRKQVQARRRGGSRPSLGIPPKGKGWVGKDYVAEG
jgi:hypothetical protein